MLFSAQVLAVACGYGFSVFVCKTKQGSQVFGAGINTDSQLGYQRGSHRQTTDYVIRPSLVPLPQVKPEKTRLVQAACGRAHTLVLTEEGQGQ